jgi:predicted P-loop ATPase
MQKKELNKSSLKTPCPVCGRTKDAQCAWSLDAKTVFCHFYGTDAPVTSANGYHFTGKYLDDGIEGGSDSAAIYSSDPAESKRSSRRTQRAKSHRQRNKDIDLKATEVEIKTDDLALMVAEGYETTQSAQVVLAAWCKEHGHDKFAASQMLKAKLRAVQMDDSDETPRLLREYQKIQDVFGERLRFNDLLTEVELDGRCFDPATAKLELVVTHRQNLKGCREDISDCVLKIAKENSYSPVAEYLERVWQEHGGNDDLLAGVAERHLNTADPVHQTLVKRFLIGAAARAFSPGCKHDCALILQGPQGYGKSTFFKILASEQWFDDSLGSSSDKDEKLKLHRSWVVEWAELETIFRRRDVSQVKAFMSSAIDILRPPFGRSIETLKRASVIVGTTNQTQFLADTTGNRRFWVVPIKAPLDLVKLSAERDRIWAAAVALYKAGDQWWLTADENRAVDENRAQYEAADPWLHPIQEYVEEMPAVSTEAILTNALELEKSKHNSGHARRVADIMRQLGWEQTNHPVSHNGTKKRVWKFVGLQKSLQLA